MSHQPAMLLLVDNDVPDAVASFFSERGHGVELARNVFPLQTPDPMIARRADQVGAVIATWNRSHFKSLLLRHRQLDGRFLIEIGDRLLQTGEIAQGRKESI